MTAQWRALDRELKAWQDAGMTLPLWWRDDDAVKHTPELERLADLSGRLGLPVHLAIIPKDAQDSLADHLQDASQLIPVVHGWAHISHAPATEKKAEFGAHRPVDDRLEEAEAGLCRLKELFGPALRPMFVPPWNRIAPDMLPWMAGLGYGALSTFTPRSQVKPAPGLVQINTHLDPIDWKGSRSLLPEDRLIHQVTQQLQDRRLGQADADEPYGILTHHLVHDAAIWTFTEALIAHLLAGPAVAWTYDERTS
ncbi:polysaccharide deacetylase family protein [Phaeobacter sp. QD34_3]|uniref:polysaccharide deacetylase family protein n=1 Tax=unclassified Phaeobacter TaxID=2621772 RepID=UPI00237FA8C5|nr:MULTISPECIES: polysaccharide deacetylase family protein [unclassified Phaeobacter]MDE4133112.1 polysaccharide deacetylase family protein [Phaeobacter sp. QD34_3]MDE4136818.1 polysaccharide deacetylase family protein [Phaeobacter sp. QD34_24]